MFCLKVNNNKTAKKCTYVLNKILAGKESIQFYLIYLFTELTFFFQ